MTPGQICFFYFNLCFPLLLFTKKILFTHTGLPQGTLGLYLNIKPKCLCSGPYLPLFGYRKKKLTYCFPEAGHSRGSARLMAFLLPHLPYLCSIKETGTQTLIGWLFWDTSLPSSQSAGFLNKIVFLASKPHLLAIWPVVQWVEWAWT